MIFLQKAYRINIKIEPVKREGNWDYELVLYAMGRRRMVLNLSCKSIFRITGETYAAVFT